MTRTLVLLLAAALAAAGESAAQAPGSVAGVVHDSTRGAPLRDAAVFLWGTPHRAASDDGGRFLLDSVPPGEYDLLFFHSRLGRLGLSPGPVRVTVESGRRVEVALGTPSIPTVLASLCVLERGGGATLLGQVSDAASGVPLPDARVRVSWVAEGARAAEAREARADDMGWYRVCGLPAGPRLAVAAEFLDRSAQRRETVLETGEVERVDLGVEPGRASTLRGTLTDAVTGEGIGGAEVWLEGTSRRMVSAPDGGFAFPDLAPGAWTLGVRHLAYGERTDSLAIPGDRTVSVSVSLDPRALPLDPIVVTVEGTAMADPAVGGTLISRTEIDAVRERARDIADVLRALQVSGIIVRRGPDGLCIGFTQGQARMMFRGDCVPALVYIDDARAASPEVAASLPIEAIDRMILLRPVEAGNLFGMGSGAGVLLIYTKGR